MEKNLREASAVDKKQQRKWAHFREDAYEQAKLAGLSPRSIAAKIGTSASNVTNLVKRGSFTSPFSGPLDVILREAVPEYNAQMNDLFETTGDALTEVGNLLMSQARLIRDPRQSEKFKIEMLDEVIPLLQAFQRNYKPRSGES